MLTTTNTTSNELAIVTGHIEVETGVPVKTVLCLHLALGRGDLWLEIAREDCAVRQLEPVPGDSITAVVTQLKHSAYRWGICPVGQQRMANGVTQAWLSGAIERR